MPLQHDVFLCYSPRDKPVVRDLAVRLRDRGLSVWFDEWEINVGDSIQDRLEAGLAGSSALVLCMSRNAIGADWSALESQTYRFRDPLRRERAFIAVRIDNEPLKGSPAQLLYLDWRDRDPAVLDAIVGAVRATASLTETTSVGPSSSRSVRTLIGHSGPLRGAAYTEDGLHILTCSADRSLRVWEMDAALPELVLLGHSGEVNSVACHPAGTHAISASNDGTVRLWNLRSGACECTLAGHTGWVWNVVFNHDGSRALSGSDDGTLRIWNLRSGSCERVFEGHTGPVWTVAYSPDGGQVASGSDDHTVRLWESNSGDCEHVYVGHAGRVRSIAYHPTGESLLSGADDGTIRVWDTTTGSCNRVLEGHTAPVRVVSYHPDGVQAVSASDDGTLRVWDVRTGACQHVLRGHNDRIVGVTFDRHGSTIFAMAANGGLHRWGPDSTASGDRISRAARGYANAKVVLVGDSQAGKSGLALRLAGKPWQLTESTIGAWATQFTVVSSSAEPGVPEEREISLWDFGGQADQRLIHQLFLNDASLAVLIFDSQREDVVARLWDWNRALRATKGDFPKILVAARTDISPVRIRSAISEFCAAAGFDAYLETSAKLDVGCRELRDTIVASIDWSRIPWRTEPELFRTIKDNVLRLKESGRTIVSVKELRDWLATRVGPFERSELDAVIGLLAAPGSVMPLGFGDYLLLHPELLNTYAQAVIRSLREDPLERGQILEERLLRGDLLYAPEFLRLPHEEERIILQALHRQLLERAVCTRDRGPDRKSPAVLVFPSYFRRSRPAHRTQFGDFMTFRFAGVVEEVYAALIVHLYRADPFEGVELWNNAAEFQTAYGGIVGLIFSASDDNTAELQLYCDAATRPTDQALFAKYVQNFLEKTATGITRLRTYVCPQCFSPVESRQAARRRILDGMTDILCAYCEARIPLSDEIERQIGSDVTLSRAESMLSKSTAGLAAESRNRVLIGEVYATAWRANQVPREALSSDLGYDMEIELRTDDGTITGQKLFVSFGNHDVVLSSADGRRIVRVSSMDLADYWADDGSPFMIITRAADGVIEWMELGRHLRRLRADGWPTTDISFVGEPFDVMSIRRWNSHVASHE